MHQYRANTHRPFQFTTAEGGKGQQPQNSLDADSFEPKREQQPLQTKQAIVHYIHAEQLSTVNKFNSRRQRSYLVKPHSKQKSGCHACSSRLPAPRYHPASDSMHVMHHRQPLTPRGRGQLKGDRETLWTPLQPLLQLLQKSSRRMMNSRD